MPQDVAAPDDIRFELTRFLEGKTTAWGIFEDRFGRLRRKFEVEMTGAWRGNAFVLDERFVYDTGETEQRQWTVVPARDGEFTATCPDCVGSAKGRCDENSIRMSYRFRLKIGGREIVVLFSDRIYRMSAGTAVNRATMSKWGVRLGELSLFFRRCDGSGDSKTELA